MAKNNKEPNAKLMIPGTGPEDLIAECASLALNLAKRQLKDGTAKAQVISHFLEAGSEKSQLELDILREKKSLLKAQTAAIQAAGDSKELLDTVLMALKKYSGSED